MTTYGRHHPEIRLTIPPCRKPIPYRDTPRTPTRLSMSEVVSTGDGIVQGAVRWSMGRIRVTTCAHDPTCCPIVVWTKSRSRMTEFLGAVC